MAFCLKGLWFSVDLHPGQNFSFYWHEPLRNSKPMIVLLYWTCETPVEECHWILSGIGCDEVGLEYAYIIGVVLFF